MTIDRVLRHAAAVCAAALLLSSCGGRKKTAAEAQTAKFPEVSVPGMLTDPSERMEYLLYHFWDGFLSMSGSCDSSHVYGIPSEEVEKHVGTFSTLLWKVPVSVAQEAVSRLFAAAEAGARRDTASNAFGKITELVQKYLYDPNSPVRNEEFYLPYAQGLAESEAVSRDMRPAYGYDASLCALNRIGTPAADFAFTDRNGRIRSLYGVRADYTLLVFVNPGCPNCREIMTAMEALPEIPEMEKSGRIAVVGIYIDEEVDKWKEYAHEYPSGWICGHDHNHIIRTDQIYNVRAIPSLYLLDRDKKVILKDAPQDKVFAYLKQAALP